MIIPGSANPLLAAGGEYEISRSLRFNSADSAYLNRTPASAGNRKTWTWSGWVKRSALGSFQNFMRAGSTLIRFTSSDTIQFEDNSVNVVTSAVYRDVSSYYHVVFAIDSTQATNTNRTKIYVNGVQQVLTGTYVTQNVDTAVNNTVAHYLGSSTVPSEFLSGYLTEVNFIDGQALTPSSFGETDPITGVWKPKKYTGTYGTNGFYLNFSDNSGTTATTLGKDYSGNGNNWTPNNFSVTAGAGNDSMVDVPTLWGSDTGAGGEVRGNYCTLNPLDVTQTGNTFSNGNLQVTTTNAGFGYVKGTIYVSSGKWYYEATLTAVTGGQVQVGIIGPNEYIYTSDGIILRDGTTLQSGLATYTVNDTIGIAFDVSSLTIQFYKNGSAVGTPATIITASDYTPVVKDGNSANNCTWVANFGQRPWAHTPPSGFKALCTTNLPEPTIKQGSAQFNAVTYTGTGANQSISVGFQPDFSWLKIRSGASGHVLIDSVRGVTKYLGSNSTAAEATSTDQFLSFDTNGFTLGPNSGAGGNTNQNGSTYVAWNWKANGAGVTNTAGTITSTVSANTTSGFSIVTWTANGSGSATVGHGLGVTPKVVLYKSRNAVGDWYWFTTVLGSNSDYLKLNTTDAKATSANAFTSSVFNSWVGGTGTWVAYCFAPVAGFSAFGSYTGNGSADGPFVYTGFRPRWVLVKRTDVAESWAIFDSARDTYNAEDKLLRAESSNAEASMVTLVSNPFGDFLSNGFKIRNTSTIDNTSGGTYIYAAFAEVPYKFALGR